MPCNSVPSDMTEGIWVSVTLLLSLVTGTAALTLSLLTWRILRESAVGKTVVALVAILALFSFYHGIELLFPQFELATSILKSISFTAVALFIAFSIRFERTFASDARSGGDS